MARMMGLGNCLGSWINYIQSNHGDHVVVILVRRQLSIIGKIRVNPPGNFIAPEMATVSLWPAPVCPRCQLFSIFSLSLFSFWNSDSINSTFHSLIQQGTSPKTVDNLNWYEMRIVKNNHTSPLGLIWKREASTLTPVSLFFSKTILHYPACEKVGLFLSPKIVRIWTLKNLFHD